MPETVNFKDPMNFAEAAGYLSEGGAIAGPGLPSRDHIVVRDKKRPLEGNCARLFCNGIDEGLWHPNPIDMIRDDWRAVALAEVPAQSDNQKAILDLDHRVAAIEKHLRQCAAVDLIPRMPIGGE